MHEAKSDPGRIERWLTGYLSIDSETGTGKEAAASAFLHSALGGLPWFRQHPDAYGLAPLPDDPHGRSVVWALAKGRGDRTVVLLHHLDVVGVEDYGDLGHLAFDPVSLRRELLQRPERLGPDARLDLESGEWLFGRGSADMKAGGVAQLAVLADFCAQEHPVGNVLYLAVPDEENLSAGMRHAVRLMGRLRQDYGLRYELMINSEPHERCADGSCLLSLGSIGKLLFFFHARGVLAHAGRSIEGFNPLLLLAECQRLTEGSTTLLSDPQGETQKPPLPTWLGLSDGKTSYDVSLPLTAFGCLNVLPLADSPEEILQRLIGHARQAAAAAALRLNGARLERGLPERWIPEVCSFGEWVAALRQRGGTRVDQVLAEAKTSAARRISGGCSPLGATRELVERLATLDGAQQPGLVVGLVPPYYPPVSYRDNPAWAGLTKRLTAALDSYSRLSWNQGCASETWFTGISDLSYCSLPVRDDGQATPGAHGNTAYAEHCPLYGEAYSVPFGQIAEIAMPHINIGPWGKDLHKLGERVYRNDVLYRTPALIRVAIQQALGG